MSAFETLAANLLTSIAAANGVDLDVVAAMKLGKEWVTAGVDLLDGHAKKKAEAAGDAAAEKITTEPEAEAELRKP